MPGLSLPPFPIPTHAHQLASFLLLLSSFFHLSSTETEKLASEMAATLRLRILAAAATAATVASSLVGVATASEALGPSPTSPSTGAAAAAVTGPALAVGTLAVAAVGYLFC